jgi:hypothetical protein
MRKASVVVVSSFLLLVSASPSFARATGTETPLSPPQHIVAAQQMAPAVPAPAGLPLHVRARRHATVAEDLKRASGRANEFAGPATGQGSLVARGGLPDCSRRSEVRSRQRDLCHFLGGHAALRRMAQTNAIGTIALGS